MLQYNFFYFVISEQSILKEKAKGKVKFSLKDAVSMFSTMSDGDLFDVCNLSDSDDEQLAPTTGDALDVSVSR